MSNQSSNTPVIATGYVTHYDDAKGFGFAEQSGVRDQQRRPISVFFRKEGCREVTGTADEPVLTDKPSTESYVRSRGRNPSRIIMKVVPGEKGPRAIAWGIIPKRNWIADLIANDQLSGYIGGEIVIYRINGQYHLSGTLEHIELTLESLTVHVRDPHSKDRHGYLPVRPGVEVLSYSLEEACPDSKNSFNGVLSLILERLGYKEDLRILFRPPHER